MRHRLPPPAPANRPEHLSDAVRWNHLVPVDEVHRHIPRDQVVEVIRVSDLTTCLVNGNVWVDRIGVIAALARLISRDEALEVLAQNEPYLTVPVAAQRLRTIFPNVTARKLRHYARTGHLAATATSTERGTQFRVRLSDACRLLATMGAEGRGLSDAEISKQLIEKWHLPIPTA